MSLKSLFFSDNICANTCILIILIYSIHTEQYLVQCLVSTLSPLVAYIDIFKSTF